MGSTALQVINYAYRHHKLFELSSFSSTTFPENIALDILNDVISAMNRLGSFWFTETKTALTYAPSTSTYNLTTLLIDPKQVIRVRREATNYWGDLDQLNFKDFQCRYQMTTPTAAMPTAWSKFNSNLYLSGPPNQDYSLYVYHFKEMPLITATTDTFLIPDTNEDVLKDCCYQMLGYKIGRWTYAEAYTNMVSRITPMLANLNADKGIPRQMPASF